MSVILLQFKAAKTPRTPAQVRTAIGHFLVTFTTWQEWEAPPASTVELWSRAYENFDSILVEVVQAGLLIKKISKPADAALPAPKNTGTCPSHGSDTVTGS